MPFRRTNTVILSLAGTISALVALEVGLRQFASVDAPPSPVVLADDFDTPTVEHRQIDEGIAISHFSRAGARLTDNPRIDSGTTVVIVGDSYVVARQVPDAETMGADLERRARQAGQRVNVRQYGWTGASPAQYLLAAPDVMTRWHPARVIIPLADNDLDFNAITEAQPAVRVDSSGTLRIVGQPIDASVRRDVKLSLVTLMRQRWWILLDRAPAWMRTLSPAAPRASNAVAKSDAPPDSSELAALPRAVVRALARAYGPSLALVYLAEVRLASGDSMGVIERRFFDACHTERVACTSTRDAMVRAKRAGQLARGFVTTAPGNGHLNAVGHEITAESAWELIRGETTALGTP